jgi:hypothetical protein
VAGVSVDGLRLRASEPGAGAAAPGEERLLSIKAIAARVRLGSSKAANRSLHSYMHGGGADSAGQGQLRI